MKSIPSNKMGSRVVQKLRDSGIEVSRDNEILVIEHFESLPKRYALGVKDAMAEILMHISLLEDARKRNHVAHCLRPAIANLHRLASSLKSKGTDHQAGSDGNGNGSGNVSPSMGSPLEKHACHNKNRILSATPVNDPVLGADDDYDDRPSSTNSNNSDIYEQDCFELTVALKDNSESLASVYSTVAATGLRVAESHGYATRDGYFLYWFVLQDYCKRSQSQFAALDSLLHVRFSMASPDCLNANGGNFQNNGNGNGGMNGLGMRRGSSFLNFWRGDLGIQDTVPEWEIDSNDLKFLDKIGQGSFGAIHKGYYSGEIVAIKTIKSDFSKEFEHVQEFSQEISIISTLDHENIVKFKGACTRASNVCIVYEFMQNGNLRDFLHREKNKISQTKLLQFGLDIVKAMVYLSEKKIVHRDLKAANILITEDHVVKIGDFGVSRLLPRDSHDMTAETGTYRWMAPEVIEHKPYGTQADVYSFGVVLWELMTKGQTPYQLLSPVQAAVGVAKHEVRPKIPPSCPKYISDIMKACWHATPEQRPTFKDLVILLQDAIDQSEKNSSPKLNGSRNGRALEDDSSPRSRSFTSMLSKMIRS
jgi:hypothetical protein